MSKPKLFALVATLDPKEWDALKKFLLMFGEPKSNGFQLIERLYATRHSLSNVSSGEEIRTAYFDQMSPKVFSNMCSRMFLQVEEWTAFHQLRQDKYLPDLLKHKFYNRRGLFKFANKTAAQIQEKISDSDALDLEKDKAISQLMHQQYYSDNPIKYQLGPKILEDLIRSYLFSTKTQSLVYLCELFNWGRLQAHDYKQEIEYLDQLVCLLPDDLTSDALVKLRNMVEHVDPSDLPELTRLLYEGQIDKSSNLHVVFCMYLLVFLLKFWNTGKLEDLKEFSRLYNYALESGILLIGGKIPKGRFYYICSVISITHSYEYGESFIEKWYTKVDTKSLDAVKAIALAQNCVYNDREEKVIPIIRSIHAENDETKMRIGILRLISLFKTRKEDYYLIKIQLRNFKSQLKRVKRKDNQVYKRGSVNFLKVLEKLIKSDFSSIEIDLNQYDYIIFRSWLNKQIKS